MVFDKTVLKQYSDLKKEIAENQARIEMLQRRLNRIESEGSVVDTVKGGDGGVQHFRIEGFPASEYSKVKTMIMTRKMHLDSLTSKSVEVVEKVDAFIASVDDVRVRRILEFRYVDNLPWVKVAMKMGGRDTEESVQMALKRFLDKN